MTLLLILAIILFYVIMYGGTVICGGLGIWFFVKSLKTRDERNCAIVALIVGLICYGLLVVIPNWLFQIQFNRMPGPPMQKFQQLFDTPLGKFMKFSSFLGTGLSILTAGIATKFLRKKTRANSELSPVGRLPHS